MKNLKISNCNRCDKIKVEMSWKVINDIVYYSKTWKCERENKEIDTVDVKVPSSTDTMLIPQKPSREIPEWCPLEDAV